MTQTLDAGEANHSPSATFMKLVDVDHLNDFDAVVKYLTNNLDKIIKEIHGFDKLLIDNGKTQVNAPPAPENGDSHGGLLLRSLSEVEGSGGITYKREFKVHDLGVDPDNAGLHKIEVREDSEKAPDEVGKPPVMVENKVCISIKRE